MQAFQQTSPPALWFFELRRPTNVVYTVNLSGMLITLQSNIRRHVKPAVLLMIITCDIDQLLCSTVICQ